MRLTEKVHQILTEHLQAGDLTIDATAGNGHDTLFLAQKVGECGQVIALDLQDSAIESTRQKLIDVGIEARVILYRADHAVQLEMLAKQHKESVAAIVFNLGYLPGSDHSLRTDAVNTHKALQAAIHLLRPTGRLCVTAYRGHAGGPEEAQTVEDWMQNQKGLGHQVECHEPTASNTPPILWILRKL